MTLVKTQYTDEITHINAQNLNDIQDEIIQNTSDIADKVDKETGKDLSSNDFTDAEKSKLAGIEAGAEVNQNAFSYISAVIDGMPQQLAAGYKQSYLTLIAGANIEFEFIAPTCTLKISSPIDTITNAQIDALFA